MFTNFRLHDEVNKRALELKKSTEYCFRDINDEINKNKKVIHDALMSNDYRKKLIKTILDLNDINDIITLSKYV